MKFVSINPKTGITVKERAACPTTDELVGLLGQSAPLDHTNYLHNLFGDPTLVVLSSNGINLPWVAVANTGEHLFGPLLIFRKVPLTWGHQLIGLTNYQIALVPQELRLERTLLITQEVPLCA